MAETSDPKSEILRALCPADGARYGPLRTLDGVVAIVMSPRGSVRQECDSLEASGLIDAFHKRERDENPSYFITVRGEAHLSTLRYQAKHQPPNALV